MSTRLTITDAVLEQVRSWRDDFRNDQAARLECSNRDKRRFALLSIMTPELKAFLDGDIDTAEFRMRYDVHTRRADTFGWSGMSGTMFFTKLVKHIPDQEGLYKQLSKLWREPTDLEQAIQSLESFGSYLSDLIVAGTSSKKDLHPARLPFLTSTMWHCHNHNLWPIYYQSVRLTLSDLGVFETTGTIASDYRLFAEACLTITQKLDLGTWELEHIIGWRSRTMDPDPKPTPKPTITRKITEDDENGGSDDVGEHTSVQSLLARIGRKLGCRIWIASNDHKKPAEGGCLGDLSLPELPPLGLDQDSMAQIRLIDVLWIYKGNQVAAAFEIECTTAVYSGILRMSDLVALAPNLNFPLYIVAPEKRMAKVERELSRPTFSQLELTDRCGFFSIERLHENADQMLRWATEPSAIKSLAKYVKQPNT